MKWCHIMVNGYILERCNLWPPVANRFFSHKPAIVIMTPADVAGGARSPRSHYDVILVMTSFATELATPSVTDVRTYVRTYVRTHYRV